MHICNILWYFNLRYALEDLQVVAGELDLTVNEGTEQIRGVTRVKPHPNYDGEDYNIAVLTVMNLLYFIF